METLSDQAYEALARLESGARMNTMNTAARELIAAGLASDDWGSLRLTEAGRRRIRGQRSFYIDDDNVANLFTTPAVSHVGLVIEPDEPEKIDRRPSPFWHNREDAQPGVPPAKPPRVKPGTPLPDPAPPPALEPGVDDVTRGYRAAGVATGITGIEVDARWVTEFVKCYVNIG